MTILEQTKLALNDLYVKYKGEGLLSLYIYGSILTDDFNPNTSDVDTIAIAEDRFPFILEEEMMVYVQNKYPDLKEFHTRILYVSELNGGEIKGLLAKFIHPKVLLLDMPNWLNTAGQKCTNQDFKLNPPTFDEAIGIRLSRIKKDDWNTTAQIKKEVHMYFLKELARIIDLIQKKRGDTTLFSYNKLLKESQKNGTDAEQKVVGAILESKKSNWGYDIFLKNSEVFQKFVYSLNL